MPVHAQQAIGSGLVKCKTRKKAALPRGPTDHVPRARGLCVTGAVPNVLPQEESVRLGAKWHRLAFLCHVQQEDGWSWSGPALSSVDDHLGHLIHVLGSRVHHLRNFISPSPQSCYKGLRVNGRDFFFFKFVGF